MYCATATNIKIITTEAQYLESIIMDTTLKNVLTGQGIEYFESNGKGYFSSQMVQSEVVTAPNHIKEPIIRFLEANPIAKKAYQLMVGDDQDAQIEQCVKCMFPNLDGTPDVDANGIITPEFAMCPLRGGICLYENKGCLSKLTVGAGELSPSEIRVFVNSRYSNEQIATKLFITIETVKKHMQNMMIKTGLHNRADLAVYATLLNLIQ